MTADAFNDDSKTLVHAIEAAETSGNLHCYLRRFALPKLAKLYLSACGNDGVL